MYTIEQKMSNGKWVIAAKLNWAREHEARFESLNDAINEFRQYCLDNPFDDFRLTTHVES